MNKADGAGTEDSNIRIPVSILIVFIIVAIIWTFLGGQGNHYYQSHDWNWRNAVFRDLIYHPWPVVYPAFNKALVYYIGYWLPSAAAVKVIGKIFPVIYTSDAAFNIGNQLLWVWTIIGIIIVEILLYIYVNPRNKKYAFFIPGILVFFSGLDIIGVIIRILEEQRPFGFHIEWWSTTLQFSSITTCLFWVFNQAVISWIITLLIINDRSISNYVFLGLAGLMCGPLPFLGIFVYMISIAVQKTVLAIKQKSFKELLKELLTLQNFICIIFYPVLWMYYSSNNSMMSGEERGTRIFGFLTIPDITSEYFGEILLFLLLEAFIFFIFLFAEYRHDLIYYITLLICCIAPFIVVGNMYDFTMRFSIPAIMVLVAMVSKTLLGKKDEASDKKPIKLTKKICRIALCVLLFIGSVTPLTEFMSGYSVMLIKAKIANTDDNLYSFDQDINVPNFQTDDYMNNSFYKYFTNVTKEKN